MQFLKRGSYRGYKKRGLFFYRSTLKRYEKNMKRLDFFDETHLKYRKQE